MRYLLLGALCAAACSGAYNGGPAPNQPPAPSALATPPTAATKATPAPSPYLIESELVGGGGNVIVKGAPPHQDLPALRLRRTGAITYAKRDGSWAELAKLTPSELERVRAAVDGADLSGAETGCMVPADGGPDFSVTLHREGGAQRVECVRGRWPVLELWGAIARKYLPKLPSDVLDAANHYVASERVIVASTPIQGVSADTRPAASFPGGGWTYYTAPTPAGARELVLGLVQAKSGSTRLQLTTLPDAARRCRAFKLVLNGARLQVFSETTQASPAKAQTWCDQVLELRLPGEVALATLAIELDARVYEVALELL